MLTFVAIGGELTVNFVCAFSVPYETVIAVLPEATALDQLEAPAPHLLA